METDRRAVPFEVTADGTGMTARAGTGLLAHTADWLGLTDMLSEQLGGCRGWEVCDPGKVVRDIVLMPADGGDALRHLNALDGQEALFGEVASASTANRTIVALADDELVIERLADARRVMREQMWAAGGAPPVVAAALAAQSQPDGGNSGDGDEPDPRLSMDIDATLPDCHNDDRDGRRQAAPTFKKGLGTLR
ncbi:MAG: hypothetical protein ACRD0K_07855 [Egibacteraceae bacterium]